MGGDWLLSDGGENNSVGRWAGLPICRTNGLPQSEDWNLKLGKQRGWTQVPRPPRSAGIKRTLSGSLRAALSVARSFLRAPFT
jgi:hypothetical protein